MSEEFQRLVANGLDFLRASVDDLERERPKYAVISFFTGLELLFKARLLSQDWRLCVIDSEKASWEDFTNGDTSTVGFQDAKERLKNLEGGRLGRSEAEVFDNLRRRRNRAVHFYRAEDILSKEKVAVEQLVGWNHLFRRLKSVWNTEFEPFASEIDALDDTMRRREDYFPLVFKQRRKELEKEAKSKHRSACTVCGQFAALSESELAESIHRLHCRVCEAEQFEVVLPCRLQGCNGYAPRAFQLPLACSKCGRKHEADPEESFHFYERAWPDVKPIAWCGMCSFSPEMSVVEVGENCFCLSCHAVLDRWALGCCENCGNSVTGPVGDRMTPGCVRCLHYLCYDDPGVEAPEFSTDREAWLRGCKEAEWWRRGSSWG
ncbi:MAG: hypothetical protein EOP84_22095, partial [Verrucomicrobiaceae bacterium]